MRDRYLSIITYFGVRNQMKKFNEECYELIEAIDNYEDYLAFGDPSNRDEISASAEAIFRDAIIGEMADVLTLCTEFICKYDIKQEEIDSAMDFKLMRTEDRIEVGYYDEEK